MPEITYTLRLLFLVCALGLLALDDWRKHRENARRWRDYLFLSAAAATGAIYFLVVDLLASMLSWEYYAYAKGFSESESYYAQLCELSVKTGVPTGFAIGALYLFANTFKPKDPSLPRMQLYRYLLYPMLCAIVISPAIAAIAVTFDPLGIGKQLSAMMPKAPERLSRLLVVWGINAGLYAGAGLGIILAVAKIQSARKALSTATSAAIPTSVTPPASRLPQDVSERS